MIEKIEGSKDENLCIWKRKIEIASGRHYKPNPLHSTTPRNVFTGSWG
jgi:hypothetical protein